jgi:hypothetical protein
MRGEVRNLLRSRLGADLTLLDALSEGDLTRLHDALEAASRDQTRALAVASDEAVRQMPAPMRLAIARMLGR